MNNEFKKMVLRLYAGCAGTDSAEFYLVPIGMTQEELDEYAWEAAKQHAESFGYYPESEMPEDYDEDEADSYGDHYTDNIEGHFEDYDPEEHDGLRVSGDDGWREM